MKIKNNTNIDFQIILENEGEKGKSKKTIRKFKSKEILLAVSYPLRFGLGSINKSFDSNRMCITINRGIKKNGERNKKV